MIIIIVFCTATDLANQCVQTARLAVASPTWIDVPCETFVPPEIRPRLVSCTIEKPGEPA